MMYPPPCCAPSCSFPTGSGLQAVKLTATWRTHEGDASSAVKPPIIFAQTHGVVCHHPHSSLFATAACTELLAGLKQGSVNHKHRVYRKAFRNKVYCMQVVLALRRLEKEGRKYYICSSRRASERNAQADTQHVPVGCNPGTFLRGLLYTYKTVKLR